MEAGGREFSLHGRAVKGVGHLGHDEAMEAGGREFDPRPRFLVQPGNWYGFLIWMCLSFKILNLFGILSPWGSSNYRPSAPFLYEVASHVKNCHCGDYYYYIIIIAVGAHHCLLRVSSLDATSFWEWFLRSIIIFEQSSSYACFWGRCALPLPSCALPRTPLRPARFTYRALPELSLDLFKFLFSRLLFLCFQTADEL